MFVTFLLGILAGVIYFNIMEKDIPHYTNCSYVANIWTDILAFIAGGIVIYYGYIYKNKVLIFVGTTIIIEHIMQFFGHKYNPLELFSNQPEHSQKDVSSTSNRDNAIIETLVRQSSRYAFAASQDESPLVAVLHANYAAGYLWALKDIVNEKTIDSYLGANKLKELDNYITEVQDNATKEATRACPAFIGTSGNPIIATLAGNM